MGEWWGRVGSLVAVGTGLGYLLGAATISEFARALGLRAADLGLGVRDYVIVATVSAISIVYLATTILVMLILLVGPFSDVGPFVRQNAAKEGRRATPFDYIAEFGKTAYVAVVAALFTVGIFLLPIFLVGEDKVQLINAAFAAATLLVVAIFVLLPALLDRRRGRKAALGRRSSEAMAANTVVWTFRWLRGHRINVLVVFLLFYLLSLVSASWIGQEYGKSVRASSAESSLELPSPPLLLRWTINPAPACVLPPEPRQLQRQRVVHLGSGPGGKAILLFRGRTILLGDDIRLAFPDCP